MVSGYPKRLVVDNTGTEPVSEVRLSVHPGRTYVVTDLRPGGRHTWRGVPQGVFTLTIDATVSGGWRIRRTDELLVQDDEDGLRVEVDGSDEVKVWILQGLPSGEGETGRPERAVGYPDYGVLVANSSSRDIAQVRVSFEPGGAYVIPSLPVGSTDIRSLRLTGDTHLTFEMTYADGSTLVRDERIFLGPVPHLLQVAIEEDGSLHFR